MLDLTGSTWSRFGSGGHKRTQPLTRRGEFPATDLQRGSRGAELICVAISALDIRDTFGPSRVAPSARADGAAPALRRVPLTVLSAGLLAVVEGVGLLAAALTSLDGVLFSPLRSAGPLLAVGLIVLAGWIVLAAGSGVALVDGSGRRTYVGLALVEIGLVGALSVAAVVTPIPAAVSFPLPLPAVALFALAVPVGKLLLVGAPAAQQWVAQGPRGREVRPDPVVAHRLLATLTLGVIGAGLVALTVLTPVADGGAEVEGTVSSVVSTP